MAVTRRPAGRTQVRDVRSASSSGNCCGRSRDGSGADPAIRGELDAGILDLNFLPVSRDKILRSIELFGTKVLPRMREL